MRKEEDDGSRKNARRCAATSVQGCVSVHDPDLCGILVSGAGLRHLYACVWLQLYLSLSDGADDFRRIAGICRGVDALESVRAAADVSCGADDPGAPSVLWHRHAR